MGKASGGLMTVVTGKVAGAVGYRLQNSKAPQGWREYRGEISNPKTKGQRVQRARFGTAVQAAALLSQIIDHSFEGVTGATQNRGRFIKEALAVLKQRDVDFLQKGEHRMPCDPFIISNGTIPSISYSFKQYSNMLVTNLNFTALATATAQDVFPDYAPGTQFTILFVHGNDSDVADNGLTGDNYRVWMPTNFVDIARFCFNPDAQGTAFIPKENANGIYVLNPDVINAELSLNWSSLEFKLEDGKFSVYMSSLSDATDKCALVGAIIASQRTGASYKYSRQTLAIGSWMRITNMVKYGSTIDTAQATYDVGGAGDVYASLKYLNNADNA